MRRVSIPARDLRILDSTLSYPSTLLGREKAIVVNLEEIKVINALQLSHDTLSVQNASFLIVFHSSVL